MVDVKVLAVYGKAKLAKSGKTYWRSLLIQWPTSGQPDKITVLGDENVLNAFEPGTTAKLQPSDMAFT